MRSGSRTLRERKITSASCEQRACHANDERVSCHFERPEGVEKSADKSVRLTVRATAARGAGAWEYAPLPRGGPDRIVSFRSALDSIAFWNRRPGGLLSGSQSGIIALSGFVATLYPSREASSRKNRTLFPCRCHKTRLQWPKQPPSQKNMTIFAGGTHGGANR